MCILFFLYFQKCIDGKVTKTMKPWRDDVFLITSESLYEQFRTWFAKEHTGMKCVSQIMFSRQMNENLHGTHVKCTNSKVR